MKSLKKFLAIIIVLAMVVTTTCFSGVVLVRADTELNVWNGTETKPSMGTGTENNPYLISTPEELAYLNAVYVKSHTYYKLTADIYLNDITKINWQNGTVDEGYIVNQWYKNTTPNWFNGVLDGDGHTVYGMYVTDETDDIHLGLFQGTQQNSQITIKNLGVDCAYVNAPNGDAAAFVGLTQSGTTTFDTCYVGANVTLTGANAGSFCGRAGSSLAISKSYSLATVTGTTRYGAAVGDCWGSTRTIDNSFFVNGPISSHTGHGFICTNVYATNIIGAYSGAKQLTTDNMQGFDVLTNADKMSGLAECGAFTATKAYPVLTVFVREPVIEIWDGIAVKPIKGTGTEEDPYLISRPGELAYLNAVYVGTHTYYKLTADIYLNDITKINWQDGTIEEGYTVNQWYKNTTPNWFNGVLDGDGHTVYGMYVTDETNDIHLGLLQGTRQNSQITIKNLGIDCAYVNAPNGDAAAFVGITQSGTTTFDTCYVGANVTLTGANAGSFCGRAGTSLAISKSYSLAAVTGTTRYGSAVGDCWGSTRTIDNSFFVNGPVTSHTGHGFICTNVYTTNIVGAQSGAKQLTTDNMQGFDALSKASKMPGLAECGAFTATKSYPVPNIFYKGAEGGEEVELEIWDGTEIAPIYGTGTEEDPYLISTPEEFAYLNAEYISTRTYYKLTADIYLNDITKINWQNGTVEEGYTVNQWYKNTTPNWFNGVLDGDGHTVYGMYVTDETDDIHLGLFQGTQQNSQIIIKNLGIDCAYVNAPNGDAAAFLGLTQSGTTTFDTCYVGANVTLTGANAGSFCGRAGSSLAISKSYSLATVTGTTRYGAAVGDCWGSTRTIDNSFFVNGPISSHTGHGFICTNVYATNIIGAYSGAKQLTTDNMQGFDVLTNADKMSGLAECGAFTATKAYPVLTVFVREPVIEIWDGIAVKPIKGTGTEEDPYLISRPGEFAYIIKNYKVGKFYKLTADIYLNDTTEINWQNGTVIGDYTVNQWYNENTSNRFAGVIDGDGHTVYGMYISDSAENIGFGLIPNTQQGGDNSTTIKNLGIDCAYVNAPNGYAGAFVGFARQGNTVTFDACYVGKNVTVNGLTAGLFYGSGASSLVISKSYSLGIVTGTTYGVVGDCWGSPRTIDNSFFIDTPITSKTANFITCTNVYTTDATGGKSAWVSTSENMKGYDALSKASKMPRLAECGAFTATKSYPVPTIFIKETEGNGGIKLDIWDGTEVAPIYGTGEEEDPYLISRPEEFAYIIKNYKVGKFYKLTADIYLNDITKINWQDGNVEDGYTVNQWYTENTSNRFAGVIDGDGHIVYGMYITDETANIGFGLIPVLQEGGENSVTIKNLGLDYAYVNAPNGYAGAFVGFARQGNTVTFDTCYVGENVTVNGDVAGLFYGKGASALSISKSYSLGTVTGTTYGVVGDCWGSPKTIDNSFFVNTLITSKTANFLTCTNVYATNATGGKSAWSIASDNMQGMGVFKSNTKMMELANCNAFIPTENYPVLSKFPYVAKKYTVTFNPNGGTVSTESIEAVAGEVNEFPAPVKNGYIFKAWYVDERLTTQATNVMPAENVTYYAKWYKLYDVNNDGEVSYSDLAPLRKIILKSSSLNLNQISIDGADGNQDAQIDVIDLLRLKKVLVGSQVNSRIPEGYRLVWNDEFDGNEVSSDKWSYGDSSTSSDTVISRDNINVSNGAAKLFVTYDTESGMYVRPTDLKTSDTINFKYGYIEMRAKMSNLGKGEWPALWMLSSGANISKDESNYVQHDYNIEIDIMEKISTIDKFQSQLHLWGINNSVGRITNVLKGNQIKTFESSQAANDWHIYAFKWTEDKLEFYLDDEVYCTYNIPDEYKENMGIYMNLILSMQYIIPSSGVNYFVEDPNLDISFEIDYVRVYQNALTDNFLLG